MDGKTRLAAQFIEEGLHLLQEMALCCLWVKTAQTRGIHIGIKPINSRGSLLSLVVT